MRNVLRKVSLLILGFAVSGMLTGCIQAEDSGKTVSKQEIAYQPIAPNQYDSEDRAIFLGVNSEDKTVSFQNAATGKRYTLQYSGASVIYDRFGQDISWTQLKTGAMTTVRFFKPTKSMTYVKEVNDAINYRETDNYVINLEDSTIQVSDQIYKFNKNVTVMSENTEILLSELAPTDVISVWGYQDQIYSIHVDKGHGYLELSEDSYFLGGWIEVGDKVIRKVSEGMRLVVPEGTYRVSISHDGSSAMEEFTFLRDEVVTWDLSTADIAVPKTGKVIFTITPASAKVYIDGKEVDTSDPIEVRYGIHQLVVKQKGYQTLSKYMKISTAWANISLELTQENEETKSQTETQNDEKQSETNSEEKESTAKKEVEEASKDDQNKTAEASGTYQIHVDAPKDAEVYVDGNYIGIAPVSFAKKSGNIVITLRKSGYQTRSYALEIDEEQKDTTYSFSELEKKE